MPRSYRKFRAYDVGDVKDHYGPDSSIAFGWIKLHGGTQLIADYPLLFAVWGTTHGGDGVTTFGIPDTRGRATIGADAGAGRIGATWAENVGGVGGEEKHTPTQAELFAHAHGVNDGGGSTAALNQYGLFMGGQADYADSTSTKSKGSTTAFNVMQPGIAATKIVRAI